MRWISVDPGFDRLGYALWDDDNLLESGVQGPDKRGDKEKWNDHMSLGIRLFWDWIKTIKPERIVAEQLPPLSASAGFSQSPQVPLVFAVVSLLKVYCYEHDIPYVDIPARHWKKVFSGDSSISKPATRRLVRDMYPEIWNDVRLLTDIPFDQCDAVGLGVTWMIENEQGYTTKAQNLKRSIPKLPSVS